MNIGFDLDKVFIDYPPFIPSSLIDKLYKKRLKEKKLEYRIPNRIEQVLRNLTHIPFLRPPIKKNLETLRKSVFHKKNNYYLISSRFSFLQQRTDKLVEKHKFTNIFNKMFFNYLNEQPHLFKSRVIRNLKIKKYIDDDLELLQFLALKNPKSNFFWLNTKEKKKLSKNHFAIKDIKDFFK